MGSHGSTLPARRDILARTEPRHPNGTIPQFSTGSRSQKSRLLARSGRTRARPSRSSRASGSASWASRPPGRSICRSIKSGTGSPNRPPRRPNSDVPLPQRQEHQPELARAVDGRFHRARTGKRRALRKAVRPPRRPIPHGTRHKQPREEILEFPATPGGQ